MDVRGLGYGRLTIGSELIFGEVEYAQFVTG